MPALAVTSFGGIDDRAGSLAARFQAHLPKGAWPEQLVTAAARGAGR